MNQIKDSDIKTSEKIFWLLQIIFSLVITRAIFDYKEIILRLDFFSPAIYSLISVLIVTMWSWLDFTQVSINTIYERYNKKDMYRFLADFIIVITYAVMLLSIQYFIDDPNEKNLTNFFLYPFIFLLYLFSGILRTWRFGKGSSRWALLLIVFVIYTSLYLVYLFIHTESIKTLNIISIIVFTVVYYAYRKTRSLQKKKEVQKKKRIQLGVDIDGVIADQISLLLPIIHKRFGLTMKYEDIDEWKKTIADTDIFSLIIEHQRIPDFVKKMPLIKNSKETLFQLADKYEITLLTAREKITLEPTEEWLKTNEISYGKIINTKEGKKGTEGIHLLIDDYPGNVLQFLEFHDDNYAILLRQPWNSDYSILDKYICSGNCYIVNDWLRIPKVLNIIEGNH